MNEASTPDSEGRSRQGDHKQKKPPTQHTFNGPNQAEEEDPPRSSAESDSHGTSRRILPTSNGTSARIRDPSDSHGTSRRIRPTLTEIRGGSVRLSGNFEEDPSDLAGKYQTHDESRLLHRDSQTPHKSDVLERSEPGRRDYANNLLPCSGWCISLHIFGWTLLIQLSNQLPTDHRNQLSTAHSRVLAITTCIRSHYVDSKDPVRCLGAL